MKNNFIDLNIKKYYKNNISYRVLETKKEYLLNENYIFQLYSVLQVFFEASLMKFKWENIADFKKYLFNLNIQVNNIIFVVKTENHINSNFLCVEEFNLDV